MTLANPAMLWTLLALLPLVGMYLLKVRPRRRPTTAYFLWKNIFHERRSNHLWHRLRSLLSLLLMAMAFGAVALALAEPRFGRREHPDLLIVIDNSASMQALSGGQSRLDIAKRKAADIARALDGVQRAAVASVADRLRYESHLTDNPRELLAAIDGIKPTYEAFRVEALPAAEADETPDPSDGDPVQASGESEDQPQVEVTRSRRVLLVSDGVLGGSDPPPGIELVSVGGDVSRNIGLVAVDLQFVPGAVDRLSFYYQVASTSGDAHGVDLFLSHVTDGGQEQLQKVIPIEAIEGVNPPRVLIVDNSEPGRWIAKLDVRDALPIDNTAYMVARRPPPVRVGVLSEDRYFLENSIQAFSHSGGGLLLSVDDAEVVLATDTDGGADRSIVFQPSGASPWWHDLGDGLEVIAPRVLDESHPILQHVDPYSISFVGARKLTAPTGSRVLVSSESGVPLIYVAKASGKAVVVLNLDPVAAEFYFSAWFPTLVHASATHLAGREEPLLAVYPTATEVALPPSEESLSRQVVRPDGTAIELAASQPLRTDLPGFYETGGDDAPWVACSLLAKGETLIKGRGDTTATVSVATGSPPSARLVFLAMIVITAESVLYIRRKVG